MGKYLVVDFNDVLPVSEMSEELAMFLWIFVMVPVRHCCFIEEKLFDFLLYPPLLRECIGCMTTKNLSYLAY